MDTRIKIDGYTFQPLHCKEMTQKILEIMYDCQSHDEAAKKITSHILEYTEWLQLCCTVEVMDLKWNKYKALWNVIKRFIINPKSKTSCVIEANHKIYKYWLENYEKYHLDHVQIKYIDKDKERINWEEV